MFTYADPLACPGCRAPLSAPARSCRACGLDLTGPAPRRVFETLAYADRLVAAMYATSAASPSATQADIVSAPESVLAPGAASPGDPRPAAGLPRDRAGLSAVSVPRILLGLGALCLVVAAVVFLAVAWAALGVGGRTGVLGVLTVVAAGLGAWLAGRDLRAGAEALVSVALGLLALDLGGAWRAGWLGSPGDDAFGLGAGLVVAAVAVAAARWSATTPVGTLVSAQAVGVLAVLVASLGVPGTLGRGEAAGTLTALLLCGAAAGLGHAVGLRLLTLGTAAVASCWWLGLVVVGAGRLDVLTVAHVWGDLAAWPLLVATGLAALPAVPRRAWLEVRVAAASVAVLLGTAVLACVAFDESATRVALVQLGVVAAYAVLVTRLPAPWRWVGAAPSVVAALGLTASVVLLLLAALPVLAPEYPWGLGVLTRLQGPDVPWSWPLLLPAGVAGVAVTAATVLRCAGRRPAAVLVPGTAATLLALALVPALYGPPLVLAVVALLAAGGVLAAAGVVREQVGLLAPASAALLLALAASLASDWVSAGTLVALTAGGVALEVAAPRAWRPAGAWLWPLTGAGLLWTVGHLAGLGVEARALPVLLVLGAVVVLLPHTGREVASAGAAALAVLASVASTTSVDQTWLAVHLTVAGVAATASSLLNADRRRLAWVGLALLTLAQWVRLQQLGVGTVEAYTLPLALVLLLVGLVSVRRDGASSVRTLAPGLVLALVPSLLLVLVDPVGVRAVVLGTACLGLVAAGVSLRWVAPLLAGALTGALLVARQATLAEAPPQWVIIGVVGVVLTVVGVTWERRLGELRRVSAYVRGLR